MVFFQSMRRDDYDKMFNQIVDNCPIPNQKVVLDDKYSKLDICFLYHLLIASLVVKVSFKDIFNYLFSVISLASYIKYIPCAGESTKLLLVHADMQPIDNLLVQWVNLRNGKTATLQHGLYVDYSNYDNINKYNYLNSVSQYFLAWGEETASLIKQYTESNVLVCGKPNGLSQDTSKDCDYFTLIFDQNIFHKQNVELLKLAHNICERLNLKMNLRLHPRNNLRWYRYDENFVYLNKSIEGSRFVIGHTSTLIYECLSAGIPAFRYKTNIPANKCDERITFDDEYDFFEKYKNSNSINFEKLGESYIKYSGEQSLNTYGENLYNIFHLNYKKAEL